MKSSIHPKTYITTYLCASCKTEFDAYSTSESKIGVEVCANCHPFYTGQTGIILDTFSRVDKFNKLASAADTTKVELKKKKKINRNTKTTELDAKPSLSLKDLLKQASK